MKTTSNAKRLSSLTCKAADLILRTIQVGDAGMIGALDGSLFQSLTGHERCSWVTTIAEIPADVVKMVTSEVEMLSLRLSLNIGHDERLSYIKELVACLDGSRASQLIIKGAIIQDSAA